MIVDPVYFVLLSTAFCHRGLASTTEISGISKHELFAINQNLYLIIIYRFLHNMKEITGYYPLYWQIWWMIICPITLGAALIHVLRSNLNVNAIYPAWNSEKVKILYYVFDLSIYLSLLFLIFFFSTAWY